MIDSAISFLFYADGLRQALWAWLFTDFPGGNIFISDEDLNPELLRTDARQLTRVFLVTIGARVLRILDTEEAKSSLVRARSFTAGEESHGTTPSEVCSNLGISLIQVLYRARIPRRLPGEVAIIDPRARTTAADYSGFTSKFHQEVLFDWILREFLSGEVDARRFGTFSVGKALALGVVSTEVPIAMSLRLMPIESEENPVRLPGSGHAVSVVRVNTKWYVADNQIGKLIPLKNPNGNNITADIIAQLESEEDLYFECRVTDPAESQYFIRDQRGGIIASTDVYPDLLEVPGLHRGGTPGILREVNGIRFPPGTADATQTRTILYWKPPASAGPAGGKRKTRKRKSKRRKTSRASRVAPRLSSPK